MDKAAIIIILKDATSLELSRIIQVFCQKDRIKKIKEMQKVVKQTYPLANVSNSADHVNS